jgi:hypothetical protein
MNLARIHEAIAEVIRERECVVFRDRRLSWLPKAFVFVDRIERSPSGEADYRWAQTAAAEALGL